MSSSSPSPPPPPDLPPDSDSNDIPEVDAADAEPAAEQGQEQVPWKAVSLHFYHHVADILSSEEGSSVSEEEMQQRLCQQLLLTHNYTLDPKLIKNRIPTAQGWAETDNAQRNNYAAAHATWEERRTSFMTEQTQRRAERAEQHSARMRRSRRPALILASADSDLEFADAEPKLKKRTALQKAMLAASAAHRQQRGRFKREKDASRTAVTDERRRERTERNGLHRRAHILSTALSSLQHEPSSPSSSSSLLQPSDASAAPHSVSPSPAPRASKFVAAAVISVYARSLQQSLDEQRTLSKELVERVQKRERDEDADREEMRAHREAEAAATAAYRAEKLALMRAQNSRGSSDNKENEHPNSS
jgi:hypothetical protein